MTNQEKQPIALWNITYMATAGITIPAINVEQAREQFDKLFDCEPTRKALYDEFVKNGLSVTDVQEIIE